MKALRFFVFSRLFGFWWLSLAGVVAHSEFNHRLCSLLSKIFHILSFTHCLRDDSEIYHSLLFMQRPEVILSMLVIYSCNVAWTTFLIRMVLCLPYNDRPSTQCSWFCISTVSHALQDATKLSKFIQNASSVFHSSTNVHIDVLVVLCAAGSPVSILSRLLPLRFRSFRSLTVTNSLGLSCLMLFLDRSSLTISNGISAGTVLSSAKEKCINAFTRRFYQKQLTDYSGFMHFVSLCLP